VLGRRAFAPAIIVGLLGCAFLSAPAQADDGIGGVWCGGNIPRPGCDVNAGSGGRSGGNHNAGNNSGGRGGDGKCRNPSGSEIPCERDGGWAGSDGCYYRPIELSAGTVSALGGQSGGEGGWYQRMCYSVLGGDEQAIGAPVWIAGAPPVISPAVLARQARSRLNLPDVVIRTNPSGDQLVNLPIWLALDPTSWNAQSATASVPGVSVTATARPVKAAWSMGDGTTVTCAGPGTTWTPGTDPASASPDCGHIYRHSSANALGGRYTVTVTVSWEVVWAGAGQSGTVPGLTTTGQLQTRVQESQAVVR
jgi:hypothetical protein